MSEPEVVEQEVAARANAMRGGYRYARAFLVLREARDRADSPFLRRQAALTLGAAAEYRFRISDALRVVPPADVLERLLHDLARAIGIDDSIPDIHWDIAVIHGRFTGDRIAAKEALDRAVERGSSHPMLPALLARLEHEAPPEQPEDSAGYRLRSLLFRLIDRTADEAIPESAPHARAGDQLDAFEDYVQAAQSIIESADDIDTGEFRNLCSSWQALREGGFIAGDPLDYGLELVYRITESSGDRELTVWALHELARFLRDFAFHFSGGEPTHSDLRKAARAAKRALDIVDGASVDVSPDLHGDLWLALGQSAARPVDLRLGEALEGYTRALQLKREARNEAHVERLTDLLRRMLDYAMKQSLGARLGFISLGEAQADVKAAFAAAKAIGDSAATLSIGTEYSTLLSALAQPLLGADVLDELLALADTTEEQRFELLFEKASRLSEARQPARAEEIQRALIPRIESQSDQVQCDFWNNYSNSLRELGRDDAALEAIDRALQLKPRVEASEVDQRGAMLYNNRGIIYLQSGRVDDALEDAERAYELAQRLPAGESIIRVRTLLTRVFLAREEYALALEHSDSALYELQRMLTTGKSDPSVWQPMLQEWSRLDELGLAARMRGGTPAADCIAFAECAKGRVLRLLSGLAVGQDSKSVFSLDEQKRALERARDWAGGGEGRWLISLFCASTGIAVFGIGPGGELRASWHDGPVYDRFRDSFYDHWDPLSRWALDRRFQSAAREIGAPEDLVLDAAETVSELLLEWLGSLLHRAFPELEAGGRELVIIPHRSLRSLPIVHARMPNGRYLSELFERTSVAPTLERFAASLDAPVDDSRDLDALVDPRGDLPFSRLEGLAGHASRTLVGRHVTRRELESELHRPGMLLVSAHGDFVEHDPFGSWLEASDGRLSLSDVALGGSVRRELIILSSCESGRSQRSNSDEPIGFPMLFLQAGARAVVAPCWQVDDLATFLLVTRFQELLVEGKEPSNALNLACHWLRELSAYHALERIDGLERAVRAAAPRAGGGESTAVAALAELAEPRDWLRGAYSGPERPFSSPVFWAGFQLTGFASRRDTG